MFGGGKLSRDKRALIAQFCAITSTSCATLALSCVLARWLSPSRCLCLCPSLFVFLSGSCVRLGVAC